MRKQRRRLPALARAGMKCNLFFCTDMCRAKNTSHPESASFAGAVRGAFPNFGSPAQRVPKFLPFPARPAGGRAVTGVGQMGRRPGRIKKDHLSSSKNQREVGPGRREPLSALVFFPPAFFQRKPGPRPGPGGQRGAAPRGQLRSHPPEGYAVPPRRARAPTKQGPSFFAQFCATFLPPPCTPACNFGPGSPGGERRFCHAHPP